MGIVPIGAHIPTGVLRTGEGIGVRIGPIRLIPLGIMVEDMAVVNGLADRDRLYPF